MRPSGRAAPRTPVAALFTPTADGYLYRENARGPAVPITAEEAHRFQTRMWIGLGLTLVGYMALMIGGSMALYGLLGDDRRFEIVGPLLLAVALLGLMYLAVRWIMSEPSRVLIDRAPVAPPIEAGEIRRRRLEVLRKGDLWLVGLMIMGASAWYAPRSIWIPILGLPSGAALVGLQMWVRRRARKAPPPP